METISKKICLESFRSRFDGKLPTLGTINFGNVTGDTEPYFEYDDYTDYGGIPYDIKFKETDLADSKLADLINDLLPIAKNFPCTQSGNTQDKTDTGYTETDILRYKTIIENRNLIYRIAKGLSYDAAEGQPYKDTRYYYLCKRDGEEYEWLDFTEEMWRDRFSYFGNGDDVSGETDCYYYDSNLPTSLKKFFFHKCMYLDKELPNVYLYYYITDTGDVGVTFEKDRVPTYYSYTNENGETEYVDNLEYVPTYYQYIDKNGNTRYARFATDIERGVNTYNIYHPTVKRVTAEIKSVKQLFKEGDVICINPKMDVFIKKFRDKFELMETWLGYGSKAVESGFTPTVEDYRNGDIVIFNDDTGETTYYRIIPSACVENRFEIKFIEMVNYLFENKLTREEIDNFVSEPYTDIPIYIEEEYHDMGLMSAYYDEWVPNKKYYIGDAVRYGNRCYVLVNPGVDETGGTLYDECEVSVDFYEENKDNENIEIVERDGKYYTKLPYYKGYFDKSKITRFDEKDANGNLLHWKLAHTTEEDFDEFFDDEDEIVQTVTSGKLNTLQRYKKSTDDEKGEELPFVFKNSITSYSGDTGETSELVCAHTELKYTVGVQNITQYQDRIYCDILNSITIRKDDDEDSEIYFVGRGSDFPIENTERTIECAVIDTEMLSSGHSDYNTIIFNYGLRYLVNDEIDIADTGATLINYDSGIRYEEEYTYSLKEMWIECENYDTESDDAEVRYMWVEYNPSNIRGVVDTQEEYDDADDFEYIDRNIYPTIYDDEMPFYEGDEAERKVKEHYLLRWMGESYTDEVSGTTVSFRQGGVYRFTRLCKFIYFELGKPKMYSDEIEMEDGGVQALVSFKRSLMSNDIFQTLDVYRDEALLGIHDINVDASVFIDRGEGVSVLERHSVLSEVATLEDLEHYRNDFFGISSAITTTIA